MDCNPQQITESIVAIGGAVAGVLIVYGVFVK